MEYLFFYLLTGLIVFSFVLFFGDEQNTKLQHKQAIAGILFWPLGLYFLLFYSDDASEKD